MIIVSSELGNTVARFSIWMNCFLQDTLDEAGIFGPGVNASLPLGRWPIQSSTLKLMLFWNVPNVFQKALQNTNICICSECKLVLECSKLLQQLS